VGVEVNDRRLSGTGCSLASEVRSLTHGAEAHMSAMDGAPVNETTSSPCPRALLPVRSELHARLRQSWNFFYLPAAWVDASTANEGTRAQLCLPVKFNCIFILSFSKKN
jgi:hypothetical protein